MGISREQALDCFRSNDLVGIGMEADAVRRRLHPEGVVSYVIERRIDCAAAMADAVGDESAVGCAHRLFDVIGEAMEVGGTGVHLVWGKGSEWTGGVEWLEGILRGIKHRFPAVWIESLSALEVKAVAGWSGLGLRETLARLLDAGLDAIAGNGPNLYLHPREGVEAWFEVQRAAHGLGMRTAAWMVFGAGETLEQRVEFLETVSSLQAETGGFGAFVPVAADVPGGRELDGVTAVESLKTLAIARMFLDNVENVQATGAGSGLKVLEVGLRFGANDLGSVRAENGSEEDVRRVIRDAGFQPAQRDMAYRTMFLS